MPIGTYGNIAISDSGQPYKARARFRDYDGVVRPVARFGQTKTAAKNALLEALRDRQHTTEGSTITPNTTVSALADMWLARAVKENGDAWATNTADTYRFIVDNQIRPALGSVRLSELSLSRINRALSTIAEHNGAGAAKTTKSALSGMCKLAISYEALGSNPTRDAISTSTGKAGRKPVRALTVVETDDMCDLLRSDPQANSLDLPDLVELMLGTAMRIGEACAVGHRGCPGQNPHQSLDLDAGTIEVNATLIRVLGVKRRKELEAKTARTFEEDEELRALLTLPPGLHVQHRTKTEAGWRILALPSFAIAMFTRRASEERLHAPNGVIFGAPSAAELRDPSNTAGDLRRVLDRLGCPECGGRSRIEKVGGRVRVVTDHAECVSDGPFAWVKSHTFRKTALTRLDDAGLSARERADVAGHARPSMTDDVYTGRGVVSTAAARILDR